MRLVFSIILTLCFLPSYALASTQKIGPDLYAYISENDASANSTFLVSEKGILVVDTGLNAQEGRKLLEEIRKVSQAPVRWIVNTHYHPDHRGGNSVVGPDAVVISTAYTRIKAAASPDYALNETVSSQPVILYVGGHRAEVYQPLTLYVGAHRVEIYHPGPAHTLGDLIVYFPDDHALSTGDLFLNNSCPAMDEGDMENWIRALDHMLALPVEHIVPGHFELASKAQMQAFRNYLVDLRDQVASMRQHGVPLAQVQSRLKLDAYKGFRQYPHYDATFKENAAAYYGQLQKRAGK
jgi:cyclase